LVPPIGRARSGTAGTENTLVHPIELLAILRRLEEFTFFGWVVILQVRLDRLVLFIELCQIRDEVLDYVHVWKRIDLRVFAFSPVDTAETGKSILAIDVHSARATNALSARSAESQSWIIFVLYLY